MKTYQTTQNILTALKSFTTNTLQAVIIAVIITSTYNNMYAVDNTSDSNNLLESVSLKGQTDNQNDLLQWEVLHASSIAYFTIECAKNTDMIFNEVVSVNPVECADITKNACFAYKCQNSNNEQVAYYKIKVTFQDNHTIESNFINIRKPSSVASLNISEIKNQGGQITLNFKSPKDQNITLNILNKTGQLLAVKTIAAYEGDNTYSYDASFINPTEMLIFSLNNNEDDLITKKYMLASAW